VELWQLVLIVGSLLAAAGAFVWLALRLGGTHASKKDSNAAISEAATQDIERIFDDTFREELRNRGRLHFEKIINENAMFLQQDLRLTTSQINEYMKQEINKTLEQEFQKYEQSIGDAKQIAVDSLEKTRAVMEEQREILGKQLKEELQKEKSRYVARLEQNMAEIINHYLLAAVGDQISLDDQLEYILSELETNKKEMLEDINNGA
jgi:hypothetical protein